MKQRYLIILALAFLCLPVLAAENYFRPGTVWTVETSYDFMHFSVHDEFIGDEIEVEGEKVLPFYRSGHGDRENARLTMYMRSEGDKVFWRSIDEEYPVDGHTYRHARQVGITLRKKHLRRVSHFSQPSLTHLVDTQL